MVKFFILLFLFSVVPEHNYGEGFEGSLQVVKTSRYDTTFVLYHVKQNKVRIEEFSNNAQILSSFIVDLEKNIVFAIDPVNKLFRQISNMPRGSSSSHNVEIIKTENYKYINGYKCNQWRVKNRSRNTEIAYWVAKDDFYFFDKMLKLTHSMGKTNTYFLFIPGSQGYLPMLAVERTVLRDEKSRFEIKRIEREILDNSLFLIPDNYKQFN